MSCKLFMVVLIALVAPALPLSAAEPLASDTPTEAATTFMQALQRNDYATCWSLLSRRSQTTLVNWSSHVYIINPAEARAALEQDDLDAVSLWQNVRSIIAASHPRHLRGPWKATLSASSPGLATVTMASPAEQWTLGEVHEGAWKVELFETLLPKWLALGPYHRPGTVETPDPPDTPDPTDAEAETAPSDPPTRSATQFLRAWQREDYATCWPLLSQRSQQGLINSYSHALGLPPSIAEEWLTSEDPEATAFWHQVRQAANLPPGGLLHVRSVTATAATVEFWSPKTRWALMETNEDQQWRVELLETVLPSWLAVRPYQGPATASVVVVGENPAIAAPLPQQLDMTDGRAIPLGP